MVAKRKDWPPLRLQYIDAGLAEGWYGYRVTGSDLFGRYSPESYPAPWQEWQPAPDPRKRKKRRRVGKKGRSRPLDVEDPWAVPEDVPEEPPPSERSRLPGAPPEGALRPLGTVLERVLMTDLATLLAPSRGRRTGLRAWLAATGGDLEQVAEAVKLTYFAHVPVQPVDLLFRQAEP